jgi:hypothetical protein
VWFSHTISSAQSGRSEVVAGVWLNQMSYDASYTPVFGCVVDQSDVSVPGVSDETGIGEEVSPPQLHSPQ